MSANKGRPLSETTRREADAPAPRGRGKPVRPTPYDKEVEDTFPASDPPASSEPGGGITGPEDDGPRRD
ncbi:MAG TPA: hypothetical protein VHD15_18770 [Hyphomicrobiales bacterium]|nr:hypothetical protein [Hyphomicrobiales bacterium]